MFILKLIHRWLPINMLLNIYFVTNFDHLHIALLIEGSQAYLLKTSIWFWRLLHLWSYLHFTSNIFLFDLLEKNASDSNVTSRNSSQFSSNTLSDTIKPGKTPNKVLRVLVSKFNVFGWQFVNNGSCGILLVIFTWFDRGFTYFIGKKYRFKSKKLEEISIVLI